MKIAMKKNDNEKNNNEKNENENIKDLCICNEIIENY